jgi:hypothetical protein
MKSFIEQNGSWTHDGQPQSREDSLDVLCNKISTDLNAAPQLIRDTLSHALRQGDLVCQDLAETTQWQWVDYLE